MRVIYYLKNNIRAIHILAITFLTLTSCGTYQQASYGDDDGIYGSKQERRQSTEVVNTDQNSAYQNYFEQKSLEADDRYGDIFTDVDSYSSKENLDSETDTEAIGYSESYSPWGDSTDDIIVNIYSNPVGYGWGFNNWNWGFNNWNWGYNYGYNWRFGFGRAFWCPYPGFYSPYYGYGGFYGYGHPYFNRYRYGSPYIAYNRGRRGNYYRNPDLAGRNANASYSRRGNTNRRYSASRSSRRANNVRATRSNTRTIRSSQNTRTRNNTRVTRNTRNTRQVRSNTRSNTTRSNTTRSNTRSTRSTRSSSFRSSGGGRSSSGGTRSSGGRGRGGRG